MITRVIWLGCLVFVLGFATVDCGTKATTTPDGTTPQEASSSLEPAPRELPSQERSVPDSAVPEPAPTEPAPLAMTYHKDARAIIETKCLGCHQAGGIGPFALDTYENVFKVRQAVASSVKDGRMPPWAGDAACNQYTNDISLAPAERDRLLQWIAEGAKEGDPKDYVAPTTKAKVGLDRVDLTLTMKKPYIPKKSPDDHRCFVLDWPETETKYITGFQIKAGKLAMVHHVIAYLAYPEKAASYTRKDPEGNGYYCPGTAGGSASFTWIGVWAPGVPGEGYPAGTGIKIPPGSKIIVQVHYNTTTTKAEGDQSAVQFRLADSVDKEAIMIPFTNYSWFGGSKKMKIPAGDADVKHDFKVSLSLVQAVFPGIKTIEVYSAMMHMHQLGAKATLFAEKDAEYQCFVDIPKWDFNWQLLYNLKKPISLGPGDKLGIQCHFDNSAANQPIIDGKKQTPKDVYWGDGTLDEMCLGVFYVTCGGATCPKIQF